MQKVHGQTTSIILTLIVLLGLTSLSAYSETQKGIAKADGTFLVPVAIITNNFTQTTTPNVPATDFRIEASEGGFSLVFEIHGERNELDLITGDDGDILYLPHPDVKGNEASFLNGEVLWNYAEFYSMINQ